MIKIKSTIFWAASATLATTSFSVAQTIATPQSPSTDEQSAQNAGGIPEVVVTARRRAENLQDTPTAVSAFTQQDFERLQVFDVSDLSGAAPNLTIVQTGGGSSGTIQPFIRGVGQDNLGFNGESPIGIYLDDVYLGRVQGGLVDLLDFERVEVLNGPQGTLYGRNSTVGAIKYVTREPSLTANRFVGNVTLGDYDRRDVQMSASTPIIDDVLAFKLDFASRNQQGYLDGVDASGKLTGQHADGIHRDSGRFTLLWAPTDRLKIDLSGDISNDHSGVSLSSPVHCTPFGDAGGKCVPIFDSPYKTGIAAANDGYHNGWGAAARVTYDVDWATLKSISSIRGFHDYEPVDFTGDPSLTLLLPFWSKQQQISQEIQLASKEEGPFNWVTGLFYFHENIHEGAYYLGAYNNNDIQTADSYAVYGDATYEIFPAFRLTAGLRYSIDEKNIDRQVFVPGSQIPYVTASVPFSAHKLTYKAGFDYHFMPDLMTYFTYSTGYKPGGAASTWPGNLQQATAVFQNETATNYELGVKSEWLNHRLIINGDGYWTNYEGLQATNTTNFNFVVYSKNVLIRGIELEVKAKPIQNVTLSANIGTIDTDIQSSTLLGLGVGFPLRFAPKFEYKLGAEYRLPVGSDGSSVAVSANYFRTGGYASDEAYQPAFYQPAYSLFDAQLTYEFGDGHYRLSVAGKNLTDTVYARNTVPGFGFFYGPPRMIYGTVAVEF
jgi:iron complex outermembrane receptor protein